MSAVAAITGAVLVGIAAAALTPFTRKSIAELTRPAFVRTPVVAALGALFGALAGLRVDSWPETLAYAVVALASALLVATDLAAHEIPHRILWPAVLSLLVALLGAAASLHAWGRLGGALLTGVVVMVCYFVIAWFGKGQFGLGDVSLSLFLGIFLGWLGLPYALVGAVGAFLVHVPVTLGVLVARRAGRTAELPFGPSLTAASWLAAFVSVPLLTAVLVH